MDRTFRGVFHMTATGMAVGPNSPPRSLRNRRSSVDRKPPSCLSRQRISDPGATARPILAWTARRSPPFTGSPFPIGVCRCGLVSSVCWRKICLTGRGEKVSLHGLTAVSRHLAGRREADSCQKDDCSFYRTKLKLRHDKRPHNPIALKRASFMRDNPAPPSARPRRRFF